MSNPRCTPAPDKISMDRARLGLHLGPFSQVPQTVGTEETPEPWRWLAHPGPLSCPSGVAARAASPDASSEQTLGKCSGLFSLQSSVYGALPPS